MKRPLFLYNNWSAYDELSDNIELTKYLAMAQMTEIERFRGLGVQIDGYVMDCFWFARDGGYRTWRTPHWPTGPEEWLEACRRLKLLPGLWIGSNDLATIQLQPPPQWLSSISHDERSCTFAVGGFLPDLMQVLGEWYEAGVRVFKWDFANFDAATTAMREKMLPSEIRQANVLAFRTAVDVFRAEHPEVLMLAYNGFEEGPGAQAYTDRPFRRLIDPAWLDEFDAIYCGDPRPSDVPSFDFWRSVDHYSDHQVRRYVRSGIPIDRVDDCAFMVGPTGTCYHRGKSGWLGSLILSLARGGKIKTLHGDLRQFEDDECRAMAAVQRLFAPLLSAGELEPFGGEPGEGQGFGMWLRGVDRSLLLVANPTSLPRALNLPTSEELTILAHDPGFEPKLHAGRITLAGEQFALLGGALYADESLCIPAETDHRVHVWRRLESFETPGYEASFSVEVPEATRVGILIRQVDAAGLAIRTTGGVRPGGEPLGQLLHLSAWVSGRTIPLQLVHDRAIWSGISWAGGILDARKWEGRDVEFRFASPERVEGMRLLAEVFASG